MPLYPVCRCTRYFCNWDLRFYPSPTPDFPIIHGHHQNFHNSKPSLEVSFQLHVIVCDNIVGSGFFRNGFQILRLWILVLACVSQLKYNFFIIPVAPFWRRCHPPPSRRGRGRSPRCTRFLQPQKCPKCRSTPYAVVPHS